MDAGIDVVSATFVTPYPPGFPVLVPGQVVSRQILHFVRDLDTKEIHGYKPHYGYRVYTEKAIEMARAALTPASNGQLSAITPAEPPMDKTSKKKTTARKVRFRVGGARERLSRAIRGTTRSTSQDRSGVSITPSDHVHELARSAFGRGVVCRDRGAACGSFRRRLRAITLWKLSARERRRQMARRRRRVSESRSPYDQRRSHAHPFGARVPTGSCGPA